MNKLVIGLMTGTSADGVDAALVSVSDTTPNTPKVIATRFHPYPSELQKQIIAIAHKHSMEFDTYFRLDKDIAHQLASAVLGLLQQENLTAEQIAFIGSHGQTIRHQPAPEHNYTVQIGEPNTLAALTRIDVITDFRRADMAHNGQGAPFAPLFHEKVFLETEKTTVVLNLGGIANITILEQGRETTGFDTGPANALMDDWIKLNKNEKFDTDGRWALSGSTNKQLLNSFFSDKYFLKPAPKSTGREYFNTEWITSHLVNQDLKAVDVQATLCELSALSIAEAVKKCTLKCEQIYLCGGGAQNTELVRRLKLRLPKTIFRSTYEIGIDPNFMEALLIAWLAHRYELELPGNLPSVTGANRAVICGAKYLATKE